MNLRVRASVGDLDRVEVATQKILLGRDRVRSRSEILLDRDRLGSRPKMKKLLGRDLDPVEVATQNVFRVKKNRE